MTDTSNLGGSNGPIVSPSTSGGVVTSVPSGYVAGLQYSWVSANEVSIGLGIARDSTDAVDIAVSALLTANKNTAGPVANGRDQAGAFGDGFIYAFIISGPSGVASLLSTSPTAPTLPAGYTTFLRVGIGLILSGSILHFTCTGLGETRTYMFSWVSFDTMRVLNGGNATVWTTVVNAPTRIPPVLTRVWWQSNFDGSDVYCELRPTTSGLADNQGSVRLSLPDIGFVSHHFWLDTGPNQQVDYRINIDPTENLYLYVAGWLDQIGAFA